MPKNCKISCILLSSIKAHDPKFFKHEMIKRGVHGTIILIFLSGEQVRYFTSLPGLPVPVPDAAQKLAHRADAFRSQICNLELIVNTYNSAQRTVMPVERLLIAEQMQAAEAVIRKSMVVRADIPCWPCQDASLSNAPHSVLARSFFVFPGVPFILSDVCEILGSVT